MNSQLIEWLNQKYGYEISEEYYKHIDIWLNWWRGYYKPFHHIKFSNGKQLIERDMRTLGMGKKVCEDWASMLLNSKTHIKISDEKTNLFMQGERETKGVLGNNSFWTKASKVIERAFATGTGAVTIHVSKIKLGGNNNDSFIVEKSPEAQIQLNYLSAEFIIPLSVDNDRITEAAFASETFSKGKKYLLLEVHRINDIGNYVIENYRFLVKDEQLEEVALNENMIAKFDTGAPLPWFSILMPNIENNTECSNGLGLSVLHNAIYELQTVDICFNNFGSDFTLGQKKVFMEKGLLEEDELGNQIAPDDVHQQMFSFIDFPVENNGEDTSRFIMEFNPSLRVEENTKAIQSALDYLSLKVGFGCKHYQFNAGTIVTAKQYEGDKQDLVQNADKHYIAIEQFLLSLMQSIIHIGKHLIGADIAENAKIEIDFDRSIIIDSTAERLQDLQEVREGVMSKWEYRAKYYNESESEAKVKIDEINGTQNDDALMGFGDA